MAIGRDVQGGPPYALIVFVMLTVILAAASVWLYLKLDQSTKDLAKMEQDRKGLLTSREAKDKPYQDVKGEALKLKDRPSVVSYLISQRDQLRSAIAADPALSNEDIQKNIDTAIAAAQVALGQAQEESMPGLSLLGVIDGFTQAYNSQGQLLSTRDSDLKAAQSSKEQAQEQMQAVKTTADQYATQVQSETQNRQNMVSEQLRQWDTNLGKLRNDLDNLQETLRTEKGQAQENIQTAQKNLDDSKKRLQALIDKVQQWRKEGGIDFTGMVTRADGKIVTIVGGQNRAFINIGMGEHLPLSSQFEVFPPGEQITESSRSKGTIQVVRVGPKLSECQVLTVAHGQSIMPGDLIVNSVYDRQNKYVFRVIGQFDLDGSGSPDTNGAKSVEDIIERWGGKVVRELEVQTDFLVVGSEPKVPLKPDNFDQAATALYAQRLKEYQAYLADQNRAVELSIPMLNHKRFLYLLGMGNRSPLEPLGYEESASWPP